MWSGTLGVAKVPLITVWLGGRRVGAAARLHADPPPMNTWRAGLVAKSTRSFRRYLKQARYIPLHAAPPRTVRYH